MSLRLSSGQRLHSPSGLLARPTTGLVRQAVTNLLAAQLPGCRWLDLCSGSGAMACEALLHGAAWVEAVEKDARIAAVARRNLQGLGDRYSGRWALQVCSVERWLSRSPQQAFNLIYADPPYAAGVHAAIAAAVLRGGWLQPDGQLLLECGKEAAPEPGIQWRELKRRSYGRTLLLQWQPAGTDSAAQGAAAAVLVPSGNEQTHQGDGNQAQHDAAEQGFDHRPQSWKYIASQSKGRHANLGGELS